MKSETLVFIGVLAFLCAFESAYSFECYVCNYNSTTPSDNQDPCKGRETLQKCQDPALCLTAYYLYEDENAKVKQYSTIKSCYAQMDNQECHMFLKNLKASSPPFAKIEFYGKKCTTCRDDKKGCNEANEATSVVLPGILAFIASYILCKLV
ncbi:hypothetical protein JTB14_036831 [Gonioctena quinquepunctata]|nr:hypothetical protein JTB14_036831 [Gonioctena quinquepunctata]